MEQKREIAILIVLNKLHRVGVDVFATEKIVDKVDVYGAICGVEVGAGDGEIMYI